MRKKVYAKYNKIRNPKFQTGTEIVLIDGKKYVEKCALTEESKEHVEDNQRRYELNQKLYKNVIPLEGKLLDGRIQFPFIEGSSATKLLEESKGNVEELCKAIADCMEEVLAYNDDVLCEFESTDDFLQVFGNAVSVSGQAVRGADVDVIFDNLIKSDGQWYSIDYEWTFDFPIPVEFIKYRMLLWYYYREESYFQGKMTEKEFFDWFGISDSKRMLYGRWETAFHYYVFGEDCKYEYPTRYANNIIDFQKLTDKYGNLEKEITRLEMCIPKLEMEIERINQELVFYKGSYNQVISSFSWRITKPVRLLVDTVKCVKEHGLSYTIRYILSGRKQVIMPEKRSVYHIIYTEKELEEQRNTNFDYSPKFSILVPLYNTPDAFLREMIESVQEQTYANWELCLADGSDAEHQNVEKICKEYMAEDTRILYKHLEKNGGISNNTNACIEMATGDFISLFDHDDLLEASVLYEIVCRLNSQNNIDVVYTDEDKVYVDKKGNKCYTNPHFKSDFNLDLLRSCNYICHFFVVKKEIVDQVGGFREDYDGSQDYDFIFRCVEKAKAICHIPQVLYHWRMHENSTAENPESKLYCYEAGKRAIESHLQRQGVDAQVELSKYFGFYRVKYELKEQSKISIIIPNKDEKDTLKKCIDSIVGKSTYPNYEIIVVENNSTTDEIFEYYKELETNGIKVVKWEQEFNYSKINNFGVSFATGDYYLLLNNDVEVITPGWMEELLANCQREKVGIVGAKLLYPDGTVQHNGVIIGLGGIAGHALYGAKAEDLGYFGRGFIQQNLNAVTAACLLVSKKVFHEVDGFEEALTVAFNDVDFCLKVREKGYLIVMNPNVQLFHYESKSRGQEDTPEKQKRAQAEIDYMAQKWERILKEGDEYYNPNLSLTASYQLKV